MRNKMMVLLLPVLLLALSSTSQAALTGSISGKIIDSTKLSQINAKVLLVYGDKEIIKLEHGIKMYHTIPGSEFCILPNTPHEVFRDNPELINKIGIDF